MKLKLSVLIVMISALPAHTQDFKKTTRQLTKHFEAPIERAGEQPVVNILTYVSDEESGFEFHEGFGWIDISGDRPVKKDQTFKIASITKMFTAVLILQLAEEQRIDLDAPVYRYLQNLGYLDFDSLHLFEGLSYGKQITIGQLLSHRSGLADIFTDAQQEFYNHVFENPRKQWDPEKLFDQYFNLGVNRMAKFVPGESFAYSDVNYFLLGLCVEQITGSHLASVYREKIIEPLQMEHTYFEYREEPAGGMEQAHAYIGTTDVTEEINTSFDWAGGGLVSNTGDLSMFIRGLFDQKLFTQKETLQSMMEGDRYGYGMSIFEFSGRRYYGHGGFWGSILLYSPEEQFTMVLSINQVQPPFNSAEFISEIIGLVQ